MPIFMNVREMSGGAESGMDKRNNKTEERVDTTKFKWDQNKAEKVQKKVAELKGFLDGLVNWAVNGGSEAEGSFAKLFESLLKSCFKDMEKKILYRKKVKKDVKKGRVLKKLKLARRMQLGKFWKEYQDTKNAWKEEKIKAWKERMKTEEEEVLALMREKDWTQIWRTVNRIRGKYSATDYGGIKEEEWTVHFDNLFNVDTEEKAEWCMPSGGRVEIEELDKEIKSEEVLGALKTMKGNSAPGIDGIPTIFYKKFAGLFAPLLAKVFNKFFVKSRFPKEWSTALIHPIYKGKGAISSPNNYRGIALLPCVGKIFTKILKNRLYKWVEGKSLLSEFQAGFRRERSTVDQGFILKAMVDKSLRKKQRLFAVFFDLKKAFDSVNRQALWFKLEKMGVSTRMMNILRDKYEECMFRVRIGGKLSEPINSRSGVLQGDQLSPLLFILFINDLEEHMKSVGESYAPSLDGRELVPMLMFADDVVFLSTSRVGLQKMIDRFKEYCDEWCLSINAQKTKAMEFRGQRRETCGPEFRVNGEVIERVDSFKYLGLLFQKNGKWKGHMDQRRLNMALANNSLWKIPLKFRRAPVSLGLHLFDSISEPTLLYGSELYALDGNWDDSEKEARKFYKSMLGMPRGTVGVGMELALGRIRMRDKAVVRQINYWKKLTELPEERLVRKAYLEMKERMGGWAQGIKKELDRLGFSWMWGKQGRLGLSKVRFKNMVKGRIADQRISAQLEEGRSMKSCKFFIDECLEGGVDRVLGELTSNQLRVKYLSLVLRSEGRIMKRSEGKSCVECGESVEENIFVHRLLSCEKFRKKRKKERILVNKIAALPKDFRLVSLQREARWNLSVVKF